MADIRLRCDTYSEPSTMKVHVKASGVQKDDEISIELTKLFYEIHKEDVDEIQELYVIERQSVKKRTSIFKKLRDHEMIKFRKESRKKFPELFI